MLRRLRISLASKCQLLFGAAVVLILIAALTIVWMRMETLLQRGSKKRAEDFAAAWLHDRVQLANAVMPTDATATEPMDRDLTLVLIDKADFDRLAMDDIFFADAVQRFERRQDARDAFVRVKTPTGDSYYRYARAIRSRELKQLHTDEPVIITTTAIADPLEMVLLVNLRDPEAAAQRLLNRIYITAAGLFAGLLALAAFWYITTRLVLSPVRLLGDYAANVSEGNLNLRAEVNTGDEFEGLANMFNQMLENLKSNTDQLRSINKSLDLKINELAQTNVALYEADKMKGDFLANVSHELRTPLNSIIGFAEVLQETLADRTGPIDEKRKRYAQNIIVSSRQLLELINDLLDLAKIEAGRMEVRAEKVSLADTCEGLVNFIRPLAEKKEVTLNLKLQPKLPLVQTEATKLQQIIFNFLSNAVKFTPRGGSVTLTASKVETKSTTARPRVRISVADTGPGIDEDDLERIFDKFVQVDPSVTKEQGGTGLGLTICKELAQLLRGEITIDSIPGKGATFHLVIPVNFETKAEPLMPTDESAG